MKVKNNTILITGGATGIGFAMAQAFYKAGNTVIICGRRQNKLEEVKYTLPGLHIRACDVTKELERKLLFKWISESFRDLNVLINNAGIQRVIDLKKGAGGLAGVEAEIQTNLVAPIWMSAYFIPLLMKQKEAAIINVSSGLGFVPIASMPVYCATKAALHSFTMSLRHQLKDAAIKVFEVIPPMVDTELGKGSVEEEGGWNRGIPPAAVAEAVLTSLEEDTFEIAVGDAEGLVIGSRTDPERTFKNLNDW
ncbi:MAG TPA: SDR family NAD(P)-dependent oxidoreductase [Dehalococcoidia bacterium]